MTPPASPNEEYFRLRAEWLRFKNHVIDSNTGLPTLAAVLDDVRRLMEERGTLALVYIDLGADGHVEPVHGWQAFDELLRGFARTLVSLQDAGHLGPRDIIAALSVRSDKFLRLPARRGRLLGGRGRARGPRPPPARADRRGPARAPAAGGRAAGDVRHGPRPDVPRSHAARGAVHPSRARRGDVHGPAPAHAGRGPARARPGRDPGRGTGPHALPAHPRPAHAPGGRARDLHPRPARHSLRGGGAALRGGGADGPAAGAGAALRGRGRWPPRASTSSRGPSCS